MFEKIAKLYGEGDLAKLFIESLCSKLSTYSRMDVIVAGAGPAGLSAAWHLSEKGYRVLVLERMLGVGGGIRGGAMLLPLVLVEDGEAAEILRKAAVKLNRIGEGLYSADPTEAMVKVASKAIEAGASIWPGVTVEDLIIRRLGEKNVRVRGVVINFAPIIEAGWHVDPLFLESGAVIDATGHETEVVKILARRCPFLGLQVPGMSSLDVWRGEEEVVNRTGKVVDGLYVAGMSVSELYNLHRMGPVVGGMLVSGKKAAEIVSKELSRS
ncbi:MAG: sulfide-dependent adenosine diphosphate thiazole synthase [Nitrososphaerota archaeon]|nr:sulfide-dependent adenosine diphosphate thiazole synthase [Candidatus Bathyarchaeota archaeon]MDW8049166.1 sulfide-dependent adenosine diphosphate thiazole synthase [Nitrososphaerota archaeon]